VIADWRRGTILLVMVLVAAAVGVPTVGATPEAPTVRFEPAELEVLPGETFEVRVMIDDVEDLSAFEVRMAYDPAVIELEDTERGEFLGSTGRVALSLGPDISVDEGTVAFGALAMGEEAGPDGSGLLATISGRALQEGSSPLKLQQVDVFNTRLELVSVRMEDGQITVSAGDAGTPASPGAFAGLGLWGWIAVGALVVVLVAAGVVFAIRRR